MPVCLSVNPIRHAGLGLGKFIRIDGEKYKVFHPRQLTLLEEQKKALLTQYGIEHGMVE